MPDILGATNPVPGYDKTNVNRTTTVLPEKVQVQNSPDLTRVSRADGKTERQDSNLQGDGKIRYDSNFSTFMQRLQNAPGLAESMSKIFSMRDIVVRSGMEDGISSEMAQLMQMMHMDKEQLMVFLAQQLQSGSRLNGALFALLRNAYSSASSATVREDILQFLKQYLDYSSMQHLEGNILRNLTMMADAMPSSWAERLRDMTAQLENGILAGDQKGNVQLLQKDIITYISKYISQTHDMGLPRELMTMLALNVSRYENGTLEKMLESFHRLTSYGTLKSSLGQINDETLLSILQRNQLGGDAKAIQFADQLASMAAKGLRGAGGAEMQQAYQDLVYAMLLNESVYMPLNHYMLPLEWDGRMLFSEFWIDPDAEDETEKGGRGGRTTRILMKVDVQNLGLFDIIIQNRDNIVDISVSYPAAVSAFSKQIEGGVVEILTQNGLKPGSVAVRKMGRPVALTEVFPKIFEGMDSINVKA